ncbi:hypothetical protein BHE74_00004063 [Ensete ventricosum]|nr:hypothetical protein BHE74_00004063 [Ensete ventricosum]
MLHSGVGVGDSYDGSMDKGEKIWCWSSTRSGLNHFGTEENSRESSRSGLGLLAFMLRLLSRRVCRGRGCRRGGLGVAAAADEN